MMPKIQVTVDRWNALSGLAAADLYGDEKAEFLIGSPEDGAVYVYDVFGMLKTNYFPFMGYDGLAAGDLNGDGKAEYVVAMAHDRAMYVEPGGDATAGWLA